MIYFAHVPVTLDAAAGEDSPRTITGVAVPWDTTASVSSGQEVMFKRGAFDVNAKAPKLLDTQVTRFTFGPIPKTCNASINHCLENQHHYSRW
jgi:hypothetical protein